MIWRLAILKLSGYLFSLFKKYFSWFLILGGKLSCLAEDVWWNMVEKFL